jgi:hypothetical protein
VGYTELSVVYSLANEWNRAVNCVLY